VPFKKRGELESEVEKKVIKESSWKRRRRRMARKTDELSDLRRLHARVENHVSPRKSE